jgi:hypothetical protein
MFFWEFVPKIGENTEGVQHKAVSDAGVTLIEILAF